MVHGIQFNHSGQKLLVPTFAKATKTHTFATQPKFGGPSENSGLGGIFKSIIGDLVTAPLRIPSEKAQSLLTEAQLNRDFSELKSDTEKFDFIDALFAKIKALTAKELSSLSLLGKPHKDYNRYELAWASKAIAKLSDDTLKANLFLNGLDAIKKNTLYYPNAKPFSTNLKASALSIQAPIITEKLQTLISMLNNVPDNTEREAFNAEFKAVKEAFQS